VGEPSRLAAVDVVLARRWAAGVPVVWVGDGASGVAAVVAVVSGEPSRLAAADVVLACALVAVVAGGPSRFAAAAVVLAGRWAAGVHVGRRADVV